MTSILYIRDAAVASVVLLGAYHLYAARVAEPKRRAWLPAARRGRRENEFGACSDARR